MKRIIIVGINHAGTHSAMTLAKNYKEECEVVCYDKNDNISFLGCGMALWIGEQIEGSDGLFYASKESLESLGAQINLRHEVTEVDYEKKQIKINNLNTQEEFVDSYDKLIIATGSWPILPKSISGIDLQGVHYAKIFQNAQNVIDKLDNTKVENITVVGGGYIGVELAEAFKLKGKNVNIITDQKILNGYYDPEFQEQMYQNLIDNGVDVKEYESLVSINGEGDHVTSITTDKMSYKTDLVLLSLGFLPNTKMFKHPNLEMLQNGAIVVNDKQETSIKDVYAIGDCATVYNNAKQQIDYVALATNALRSGIVAAHNAAGRELKMQGVQASNAISIFELNLCSTGLTVESASKLGFETDFVTHTDLVKPAFMKDNHHVTIKIVWEKASKRIIGAQLISRADVSLATHLFSLAIEQQYTIDKLALLDLFFLPHFNQPHNFITEAGLKALEKL